MRVDSALSSNWRSRMRETCPSEPTKKRLSGLLQMIRPVREFGSGAPAGIEPATPGLGNAMATPPEATLQLVHGSEKSQLVSPGGRAGSLTLTTRIGELDLSVSAVDNESGIQDIQFCVNTRSTTCQTARIFATAGPGFLGSPRFPPQRTKTPGDVVAPAHSVTAPRPPPLHSSKPRRATRSKRQPYLREPNGSPL
jgi:hypothetical protein